MILLGRTREEILIALDSLILLLQSLGFVINREKSQFQPVQRVDFLDLVVNSISMTLALLKNKIEKLQAQCEELISNPETKVTEST